MWWKKSKKPIQPKAIAYYRDSEQDGQEGSIATQREIVKEFACKHGIKIIREFVDHSKSRLSTEAREDLKKMIKMIADPSKEFDYVLLCDVSNWALYQDLNLSAHYHAICEQYGRKVIYADLML